MFLKSEIRNKGQICHMAPPLLTMPTLPDLIILFNKITNDILFFQKLDTIVTLVCICKSMPHSVATDNIWHFMFIYSYLHEVFQPLIDGRTVANLAFV